MTIRDWLMLVVTVLVGLAGLFYASGPQAGTSYGIGLIVFGLAVIYAFFLLKRHFDSIDTGSH